MKTSTIRFAQLRQLLLDLHFKETRNESYWRFDHPESATVFLFRPYTPNENISVQDLDSTRRHLAWRGLLGAEMFDDFLTKTPA